MRNQWYGDHRDLVKWGTLMQLARAHSLRLILQVAYLRLDHDVPLIKWECGEEEVGPKILEYFRDIHLIRGLAKSTGIEIEVFDRPFAAKLRDEYTADVVSHIKKITTTPCVILLDPDTGLSTNRSSSAHVTPDQVSTIWSALRPKDWLVVYQHASREMNWSEKRRAAFEAACQGGRFLHFRSPNGAHDVALFAASSPSNASG